MARGGAQDGRRLAHRVRAEAPAHDHRVELPAEDRGDHRAGNDAGRSDADDDVGVVVARDLERQAAGELAEQRPLDLEYSLRMLDRRSAW